MKKILTFSLLCTFAFLLQACSFIEDDSIVIKRPEEDVLIQEVTLKVEDDLKDNPDSYRFNGFLGEDTLSFEWRSDFSSSTMYLPAKKGYEFSFKKIPNVKAKIVDFNRDKGYVKLRLENTK